MDSTKVGYDQEEDIAFQPLGPAPGRPLPHPVRPLPPYTSQMMYTPLSNQDVEPQVIPDSQILVDNNTGSSGNVLCCAIMATFCCFLPTGIVAIIYAVQSQSSFDSGNMVKAKKEAAKAKKWAWISLGVGVILIAIMVILQVVLLTTAADGDGP